MSETKYECLTTRSERRRATDKYSAIEEVHLVTTDIATVLEHQRQTAGDGKDHILQINTPGQLRGLALDHAVIDVGNETITIPVFDQE